MSGMNESKHKDVTMVVLSYLIGFTTAGILFGLTDNREPLVDYNFASAYINKGVTNSDERVRVINNSEGLFLIKGNNKESLLSAAISNSRESNYSHYSVITASASANEKFIHYCSQNSSRDDFCNHFIYSVIDNKYFPVISNGNQVTSSIENINTYWEEEGFLYLDGLRSVSTDTPWLVSEE